jgi:hypothetical protein
VFLSLPFGLFSSFVLLFSAPLETSTGTLHIHNSSGTSQFLRHFFLNMAQAYDNRLFKAMLKRTPAPFRFVFVLVCFVLGRPYIFSLYSQASCLPSTLVPRPAPKRSGDRLSPFARTTPSRKRSGS